MGATAKTLSFNYNAFCFSLNELRENVHTLAHAIIGDFCLITDDTIKGVLFSLSVDGIDVEQGPVRRQGAREPMTSVYFETLTAT